MYVYVYVYMYMHIRICICNAYTDKHIYIYIYIHIYVRGTFAARHALEEAREHLHEDDGGRRKNRIHVVLGIIAIVKQYVYLYLYL